jgi:hypothetical protein
VPRRAQRGTLARRSGGGRKDFGLVARAAFGYPPPQPGWGQAPPQRKDSVMAGRRRTIFLASVLAVGPLLGAAGCNHPAYPQPYGTVPSPYGNPWAAPGAAGMAPTTTLPPPVSHQAPAAIPQLPPPQGAATGVPTTTLPAGVQGPNWNNPGTLTQQQQRATVFDPFANNEVGPEVVGGRPREFQKPMNEAARAHGFRDTRLPF